MSTFHIYSLHSHRFQLLLPLQDTIFKLDKKDRPIRPDLRPCIVRTGLAWKPCSVTNAFNDTCNECRAAELVHLLRHRYELIRQWCVVNDHILARAGG